MYEKVRKNKNCFVKVSKTEVKRIYQTIFGILFATGVGDLGSSYCSSSNTVSSKDKTNR